MTNDREPSLDRRMARRLLDGDAASSHPVAALLAAAASAPRPDELAGAGAALAAFRATPSAASHPASPQASRRRLGATRLAPLLAAKLVLTATAATAAVGGVSLAAATGTLPAPLQRAAHNAFGAPPPSGAAVLQAQPSERQPAPAASTRATSPPAPPSADAPLVVLPPPALRGLCVAVQAPAAPRGTPQPASPRPTPPPLAALTRAAGGADKVAAFCAELLATPPGAARSGAPGQRRGTVPGAAGSSAATHRPDAAHDSPGAPKQSARPDKEKQRSPTAKPSRTASPTRVTAPTAASPERRNHSESPNRPASRPHR